MYFVRRERSNDSRRMVPDNPKSLVSSGFDGSKPTKILIHGWLGDSEKDDSVCLVLKTGEYSLVKHNIFVIVVSDGAVSIGAMG